METHCFEEFLSPDEMLEFNELMDETLRPHLEQYRFFPTGKDLRLKNTRFVFGGDTIYEQQEEEKYKEFLSYLDIHWEKLQEVPEE